MSLDVLPDGCRQAWHNKFVPMYIDYMGQLDKVWDLKEDTSKLLAEQQRIWSHFFPDVSVKLVAGSHIYRLVSLSPF
jgi:hypothetical protein